ncbi:MAG: hypothetical protein A2408_01995 [Candidatus Yonathbacteria bacterium RIFOXYC1_FULL_52_10]|uniref:Cthe-2314-like HEPN domain-containing protein n=1 Tax=Candidatus Yonathbacteria bacterium RIFOXYD1_FULL_52_36 TaxID=1802730 RepID=A0A1G2SMM0_9BACT|nr:MAG: hypothetical protein A2408_01995 [Candidatus Yonathbacteria bacterium RIFOXYC1_FULL_52_10]OHA86315.1 MAG: hypothetical protein A2591_01915 [Candidatus Yonathbacteria bacterium RIFOXYD1_FULL_52_36]
MQQIKFSGDLKGLSPKRLVDDKNNDSVENFFLVLGLFYNDLKSLNFQLVQLGNTFEYIHGKEVKATNDFGEYAGLKSHLERMMIGTLSEFFRFINDNQEILKTERFRGVYSTLNRDLKGRWDLIAEIAFTQETKEVNDFAKVLMRVRNNLSFHYYQSGKTLRKGFIEHFLKDGKSTANEKAYFSSGETMEETRFFFCDAASQRAAILEVVGEMSFDEYSKKMKSIIEDLNFVIMRLMKGYIDNLPHKS